MNFKMMLHIACVVTIKKTAEFTITNGKEVLEMISNIPRTTSLFSVNQSFSF